MPLSNDTARCAGKTFDNPANAWPFPEYAPECIDCQRRTDRSTFPLQSWTGAPDESPCPLRIAPEAADGQPAR
jgi:hypothetical protein